MPGPSTKANCEICGKEFMARIRDMRKGWGRFCSINCANKYRATGESNPNYINGHRAYRYPRLSRKYREEIRERDGHLCRICNREAKKLHVHHVIPIRDGGSDDADNLMTLCPLCHNRVEHGRIGYHARPIGE